jgi:hypothetical protein
MIHSSEDPGELIHVPNTLNSWGSLETSNLLGGVHQDVILLLENSFSPDVFIDSTEFQSIVYDKENELTWMENLFQRYEDREGILLDMITQTQEYIRLKKWEFRPIALKERLQIPEYKKYMEADGKLWRLESLLKIQKITRFYEKLNQKIVPDDLYNQVLALDIPETIESLLSHDIQSGGSNAQGVFLISGTNLVAIQKSEGSYPYNIGLPYLTSLFENDPHIPRTYQVFRKWGYSYQILDRANGKQMDELSPEYIRSIPQQHFDEFVRRAHMIESCGLKIDPSKSSNFFYDPDIGFSFIDLGPNYNESTYSILDSKTMTTALTKRKNWRDPFESELMEKITEKLALALEKISKTRVL